MLGQAGQGIAFLDGAMALVEKTDERYFEAELHRLRGELLVAQSIANAAEATTCFRRATDVAARQGAKLWQLRTATSLARLCYRQGRTAEARDLLAPVYGWFTEGFDTPDLVDASALLDSLS